VIRQTGTQVGNSFQADSLSMVDVDTTAPTAPSGLTVTAPGEIIVTMAAGAARGCGKATVAA
jgi:hypothetical protein